MDTNDYIESPTEVRSVLGVSPKELEDGPILSATYFTQLLERLAGVAPDLDSQYQVAKAAGSPTAPQARLVRLVKAFCTYQLAGLLIPAMPTLIPKRLTDGKAENERVDNPFALMQPQVEMQLAFIRRNLADAYTQITSIAPSAAGRRYVADIATGTDPVTG